MFNDHIAASKLDNDRRAANPSQNWPKKLPHTAALGNPVGDGLLASRLAANALGRDSR